MWIVLNRHRCYLELRCLSVHLWFSRIPPIFLKCVINVTNITFSLLSPSNYAIAVAVSFNRLTFLTRIQLCHPSLLFPPAPLTSRAKAKTGKLSLTFIASASTKLSRLLQARQTGSNNGQQTASTTADLNLAKQYRLINKSKKRKYTMWKKRDGR